MTWRAAVAWMLAVLVLAAPLAVASEHEEQDHDEERQDDEDERKQSRKVEVELDDGSARIELKREDGSSENKVEMSFESDEATFEVKFEAEENKAESEEKLEVAFVQLFEYVDADNDSRYDAGESIASAWPLGEPGGGEKGAGKGGEGEDDDEEDGDDEGDDDAGFPSAAWRPLVLDDVTADDGTPGKRIRAEARLGNGSLAIDMYAFGKALDFENASLGPTEVKIDIRITDYPFTRNDTAIGLILETKAESEMKQDDDDIDDDEAGVAATSDLNGTEVTLVFSWLDTAHVDGNTTEVHTTTLRQENETKSETAEDGSETKAEDKRLFVLSYARGSSIIHDPTAGVRYTTQGGADEIRGPGVGTAAVLVAATTALILLRRR